MKMGGDGSIGASPEQVVPNKSLTLLINSMLYHSPH